MVRLYLLKKFRKRLSRKYAVTVAPISTLRLTTRSCGGSPLARRPLASVGLWLATMVTLLSSLVCVA